MCLVHNLNTVPLVFAYCTCQKKLLKLLMMVCGKASCKSTAKEKTILSCIDDDLAEHLHHLDIPYSL